MWFLPMLFWCFVFGWIVIKIDINNTYIWILIIGLAMISYIPLPFRLGIVLYYLPFFLGGGFVYKYYAEKIKNNIKVSHIIKLWILFAVIFVCLSICNNYLWLLSKEYSIIYKAFYISVINLTKIIYAALGVITIYCTAVWYSQKYSLNSNIISFGKYCFGIYLFQQFILQIIYYKTEVPVIVGSKWLPWFGFITTLLISTILSFLLSKTRAGRLLIG